MTEITAARAHLQFELQRYDDAAASYARLAALRPQDSDVRSSLGLCLQNLGRYAEAVESFRQALALGAKALEMQLAIGACLLHLNEPQEAREAFDAALARVPDNEAAMFGKAVALQMGWEFEEAATLYQRILERNPKAEDSLVNMISLSLQRKDYEMVRKLCGALAGDSSGCARRAGGPDRGSVRAR